MKARFSYAITFVSDMEKAIAFHREVLCLTPKFTSPPRPQSGATLARIRTCEGAEVSLSS